jgi:hypothetical protein
VCNIVFLISWFFGTGYMEFHCMFLIKAEAFWNLYLMGVFINHCSLVLFCFSS